MRAVYILFYVSAIYVVKKTSYSIFGETKIVKYNKSKWRVPVVCFLD